MPIIGIKIYIKRHLQKFLFFVVFSFYLYKYSISCVNISYSHTQVRQHTTEKLNNYYDLHSLKSKRDQKEEQNQRREKMSFVYQLMYGFFFFLLCKLINACYLSPIRARRKLRENGLGGPTPFFPLGNLGDMKKMLITAKALSSSSSSQVISHDIHSSSLPYFAQWQKLHGEYILIYYEFIVIYTTFVFI